MVAKADGDVAAALDHRLSEVQKVGPVGRNGPDAAEMRVVVRGEKVDECIQTAPCARMAGNQAALGEKEFGEDGSRKYAGCREGLEESQGRDTPDGRHRESANSTGACREALERTHRVVVDEIITAYAGIALRPDREGSAGEIERNEIGTRRLVLGHAFDVGEPRVEIGQRIGAERRHHQDIAALPDFPCGLRVERRISARCSRLRVPRVVVDDGGAGITTAGCVFADLVGRKRNMGVRLPRCVFVEPCVDDQLFQSSSFRGAGSILRCRQTGWPWRFEMARLGDLIPRGGVRFSSDGAVRSRRPAVCAEIRAPRTGDFEMKRALVILLVTALLGGAAVWLKRDKVLLAVLKFRSATAYEVAANRPIPWSKGPAAAEAFAGERPPNIILIVADDLGYNDLSAYGGGVAGGRVATPHIDQLAAGGVRFGQSYSGASTCAPSRAMMMTGRYPTRTGFEFTPTPAGMSKMVNLVSRTMDRTLPPSVFDAEAEADQPPFAEKGLPAAEVTIAEMLQEKGYYTAHIGKWHLGRAPGMAPHDQGFEDSLLMASGLYLPESDPGVVNAKLAFDPIDQFLWSSMTFANSFNSGDADRFEPGGYLTDYWTDESIRVIEANQNRPFFLYLAHWGTHTPLQATREDYEAVGDIQPHRLRVYAAMVRALDRSVGRIMDTLEETGLADNTVVLFTSDNGGPGYLGLPDVNSPFRGWKITMFEGGLRVPLFVHWPAKIAPGSVVQTPVAHIDLMPTLAAMADAPLPRDVEIDGENLLPLALSEPGSQWSRETLFWQNGHYQVVRHGDWKLQVNDRPGDGRQHWLFDLASDPTEQNNLAQIREDKRAELAALLDAHQASSRGPLYPHTVQMPVMIDKTLAEAYVEGDEYVYTPN